MSDAGLPAGVTPMDAFLRPDAAAALPLALLDLAHDAVIVRDRTTGAVRFWNRGAADTYGYTAEEATGRVSHELLHTVFPTSLDDVLTALDQAGDWAGELVHQHADGRTIVVESRWAMHQGVVLEINRDITARRAAERLADERATELQAAVEELGAQAAELEEQRHELEEQRDELATQFETLASQRAFIDRLLQHVPVAIAYLDRDMVYRASNPMHTRMMGVPEEKLIGRSFGELLPEAEPVVRPIFERAMATGQPQHDADFALPSLRGGALETTYWDFTQVPVPGPDGRPEGTLVLAIEVTDRVRRAAEQQAQIAKLEELDRFKDEFISTVSHELRTPISAIMGYGDFLDEGLAGDLSPQARGFVTQILTGASHLLAIVNDLLDMSRLQAGTVRLDRRAIAIGEVAAYVVASLSSLASRKRLTLESDVPEDLPAPEADEQRVSQVLVNLVNNAIKFTPEGGRVRVSARREDGAVRIEVTDTGIGIAEADLPRLFQRYGQLDGAGRKSQEGTGLGLSIAKGLVEAHGGQIGVTSTPGHGSTFWFTLPITAPTS
jgi:PAS domain S-box-containing protein